MTNYHDKGIQTSDSGKRYVLARPGEVAVGDSIVNFDYPKSSRGQRIPGPGQMIVRGTVTGLGKEFKVGGIGGEMMQYAYVAETN